jgi:adenosylcobyric acid synthase
VADIERGGVFASLVGTLELLPEDLRERVVGTVITKFRGDRSILAPGIEDFEERTGVPVLGVLPYDDPGLPAEDSVSLPAESSSSLEGTNDDVSEEQAVRVAVPRLPRISNFTDFGPLARTPGVRVAYVPLDGTIEDTDAVVLPGTKNTVDDLLALRESGMAERVQQFDGPVVGLCGGYQMLGECIRNAALEGTGDEDTIEGLGLLPVETRFEAEKRVEPVSVDVEGVGPLDGLCGTVTGYEIHMGRTRLAREGATTFGPSGAATDRVLGTYLHGLFENERAREAFVATVREAAGLESLDADATRERSPYDCAADLLREHVDLSKLLDSVLGE